MLEHRIITACRKSGIPASMFGRAIAGDSRIIYDLRNGRTLRASTAERLLQRIDAMEANNA